MRLKNNVAIRKNHRLPPLRHVLHRIHRIWKQAIRERIAHQEIRHRQQIGIVRIVEAITLQRSQVIGVSEFRADLFETLPISLRPLQADAGRQVALQVRGDMIVVEQRVVHVKEKNSVVVRHVSSLHWLRLLSVSPIGRDGHLHVARQVYHLLHQASARQAPATGWAAAGPGTGA